jgi:hypothetical protein
MILVDSSLLIMGKFTNSLLVAQAFILKYPNHGKEYGLAAINYAIEDGINESLF